MQLATINYWQRIKQAYPTRQDTATKTDSTSPARDETTSITRATGNTFTQFLREGKGHGIRTILNNKDRI